MSRSTQHCVVTQNVGDARSAPAPDQLSLGAFLRTGAGFVGSPYRCRLTTAFGWVNFEQRDRAAVAPPAAIFIRRIETTDWTLKLNFIASIHAFTTHIRHVLVGCVKELTVNELRSIGRLSPPKPNP
jgi:hypothetical protein